MDRDYIMNQNTLAQMDKMGVNVAVQVNGKLRGSLEVDKNLDKEKILSMSKEIANVKLNKPTWISKFIELGNNGHIF